MQAPGRHARGFTLVEILVALGLFAVIVAFAAPSFANMARRHRVDAFKDSLIGTIQLARTEAIRLGEPVVLRRVEPCPEATSRGDWRCGWLMFADPNGNQALDQNESLLQTSPIPVDTVLRKAGAVNPVAVAIDRFGQVTQAGTRLEIYPAGKGYSAVDGVLICFPAGSRIRTVRAAAKC
ncbi:MAG: GspH/FimT family pseudopilin [Hydrogenophaga sp.]|uniref:GspH/FimT family pseudopilin n=1 Tax=Hydrogenophaga sp. TaxID=1904254 RepID=UPI003D0B8D2F